MNVNYDEKALVITLPTSDPIALHDLLMHGLTAAMRCCILNRIDNEDVRLSLVELLECLLPEEKDLCKMCA